MAIVVEHDKRRKKILERALDLFSEEGYEDVTFQKIADRCGITRTTLYIYFKNKREIFMWSIKQLTDKLEEVLVLIIDQKTLSVKDRLKKVFTDILDCCISNRKLFSVILAYLLQIQKTGKDPGVRVRRRILRLRHLMSTLLIEGIDIGEFKKIDVKAANELFYSMLESAIFRLAILDQTELPEFSRVIDLAIDGILQTSEN